MNNDWIQGILSVSSYFLVLFLGIIMDIVLLRRHRRRNMIDNKMRDSGLRTSGRIVSCHKEIITFNLVYTYEIQGNLYSQIQHVDEKTFNNVNQGDDVIVCYYLEKPEKSL